jgi:hypothetical protein
MKRLVVVCLGLLILSSAALGCIPIPETFSLADRVGEGNERSFFILSTSAGNYTIRHDGMGEFTSPAGMRRVFYVKAGTKGRIDLVYFLEHEGDLLLLYEVRDQGFYLARMEQKKRKLRWLSHLGNIPARTPIVDGNVVIIGTVAASKADGKIVEQD